MGQHFLILNDLVVFWLDEILELVSRLMYVCGLAVLWFGVDSELKLFHFLPNSCQIYWQEGLFWPRQVCSGLRKWKEGLFVYWTWGMWRSLVCYIKGPVTAKNKLWLVLYIHAVRYCNWNVFMSIRNEISIAAARSCGMPCCVVCDVSIEATSKCHWRHFFI